RVVPPVVERRRGDHRECAPDAHPRAERRTEPPETHCRPAICVGAGKCGVQRHPPGCKTGDDAAEVNRQVRWRPERIAADRTGPGDVPDPPEDDARRCKEPRIDRPMCGGGTAHSGSREQSAARKRRGGWAGHAVMVTAAAETWRTDCRNMAGGKSC